MYKSKLNPGDIVIIWQDPLTKTKEEGFAKLVELDSVGDDFWNGIPIEVWLVEFGEDEMSLCTVRRDVWNGKASSEPGSPEDVVTDAPDA